MSNRKVLLVDDSKSARYALRLLLQKRDFEVDTAESAEVALAKIKENSPEVVFMDHLMSGMNGFEALEILKKDETTARIPVVMCTSNDEDHYQREAREKGALGILPKPATPDKLANILTAIESDIQAHAQAPTAATEPAPEPVAATTVIDSDQIVDLIRDQLPGLLRVELSTLLERELPPRVDALRDQLQPAVAQTVTEQLRQENEAGIDRRLEEGLAQMRDSLATAKTTDATSDLEQKIDTEIKAVRAELVRMETEHVQAVAYKLSHEVLPEMINKQIATLEVQVNEHIESRLKEFSGKIGKELLQQPALVRQFSEAAEASAEHKAREVATGEAREIAESVAIECTAELADSLTHSAQGAVGRMYLLAAGAAVVGIAAAFAVNMLF